MRSRNSRAWSPADEVARWFELYIDDVQQYVARRVGAEHAPDVVADTFRVAVERVNDFDPERGPARAWLFGIATNLVRRHWRTEQRRLRAYAEAAWRSAKPAIDPLMDVDGRLDARRRLAELADVVAALPPDDLDVLVLTAWEGMTSSEVATVLDVPAGTVRSRLNRVRTQLNSRPPHQQADRSSR
jgi:RNA polymerase sigma-70 factor, ECF subfamily